LIAVLFIVSSIQAIASTYVVTNTNDSGTGSLRQAILDANASGPGPHNITFHPSLTGGTVTLSSSLPIVSVADVTIDGSGNGSANIIIDAGTGDNTTYIFRADAGGVNATFKNFVVQDTGNEPFYFTGSPAGITIENIVARHNAGGYLNHGVYYVGNANGLTVRNFTMTQQQSNASLAAIQITGTANNILIDNFNLSLPDGLGTVNGLAEGIWFGGIADSVTIENCTIDLDDPNTANDADYGIHFVSNASNVTINNTTINNCDLYAMHMAGTSTNFNINGLSVDNAQGEGPTIEIRFVGAVDGLTINNTVIELDHDATTDDGDYGIYFDNTASNVSMDGLNIYNAEVYGMYVGGTANTFSVNNSVFSVAGGAGTAQLIRFNTNATDITMNNVTIDCDVSGTTDDSDYGLVFAGSATNVTLTGVSINEADLDGIYTVGAQNFALDGCTFTKCYDGIEFYNNVARSGNMIQNCVFDSGTRSGMIINVANATTGFTIINNTFSNHQSDVGRAIWLYSTGGLKAIDIINNNFFNNYAGIYNEQADGVLYFQNSFYNNLSAIDNVANDGNYGYELSNGKVPVITSSVDVGGGNYGVTFTLPAFCTDCNVEIYTNQVTDAEYNGRTYVYTATNLAAGSHTVTVNSGGSVSGFWTAILSDNNTSGSTSEFSNAYPIALQGPANVDSGIALWARADISGHSFGNFTTNNGWRDYSGNGNHFEKLVNSDPELVDGMMNFNPSVDLDGDDWFALENASLVSFPVGNSGRTVFVVSNTRDAGLRSSLSFGSNAANQLQAFRHENGTIRYIGIGNDFTGAGAFTVGVPFVARYEHDGSTNTTRIRSNGLAIATTITAYNTQYSADWAHIGVRAGNGTESFIGDISEVIVYNRDLTLTEKNKVESYLAIKYGVTLDQSTPQNYTTSDGTVIWNATTNASYANDIAGIGRDDATVLNQKQSRSINTGSVVTIGQGNIATTNGNNTNTFAADKNFLVWGNDGASMALQSTELPAGATALTRVGREWKVQETGSVSNLTVAFDINRAAYNIELYIDTDGDGDFTNAIVITGGSLINGQATFTGVNLNNGDLFTLGYSPSAPGGVMPGIGAWWRSDIGATTTAWDDFSGNGHNTANVNTVTLVPDAANFNPALTFNSSYFQYNGNPIFGTPKNYDNVYVFAVGQPINGQFLSVWGERANNGYDIQYFKYNDDNLYFDAPYGYRLNSGNYVADGAVAGVSNLFAGKKSTTAITNYIQGKNVGSVAGAYASFYSTGAINYLGAIPGQASTGGSGLSEVIVYENASLMTATQVLQINSYLALKYGITLDQTSATNYLASDASVVWNATANSTYSNDIAGIGRDDFSVLSQKQSRSVNSDDLVTIALGSIASSNQTNANAFVADKNFLLWGNDNTSTGLKTSERPTGAVASQRLIREWKVAETGSVSNLSVAFDIDNIYPQAYDFELYVDTDGDGDFSNATIVTGGTLINGQAVFTGIDLNNGDLFTLGLSKQAPGGVAADLQLWLKADAGVTGTTAISSWKNQSANVRHADMSFGDPAFIEGSLNFNPIIDFDGDDYFRFTASPFVTAYTAAEAITVVKDNGGAGAYGHPYDFGGSSRGFHYTWSDLNVYQGSFTNDRLAFNPANNTIADGKTGVASIVGDPIQTSDWNIYGTHSATNNWGIQFNGQYKATSATNTTDFSLAAGNEHIGAVSGTVFRGETGEIILYNRALTATERLQVNSYLALKYGLTLNQSSPNNYLSSDATVIWNATSNAIYSNDIAGIGRDDLSALEQKQSRSINSDAIVTIALGQVAATNQTNTNSFAADQNFLVWGNDNASTSLQTSELPAGAAALYRMGREWKVAETGSVSNLTVSFDGMAPLAYDLELYIDTDGDGDFTNATIISGGILIDGQAVFSGVDLNNGDLFTLGLSQASPGGVVSNLSLWLRADIGVYSDTGIPAADGNALGTWLDQSGHGRDGSAVNLPTFNHLDVNFNPSVTFNGTNNYFDLPIGILDNGNTNYSIVSVQRQTATKAAQVLYLGGYGTNNGIYHQLDEGDKFESSWSNSGFWGGNPTPNEPDIYTATYNNTTGKLIRQDGLQVATDAQITFNYIQTVNNNTVGVHKLIGTSYFNGEIDEVIVYNNKTTSGTELRRIESYLAIKYGITLDQTTPQDYLSADASVLWDAATYATYSNDIAGIGRDDLSALNQKQSISVNSDALITIGLGGIEVSNLANSNSFATDNSFLIWGNDNASISIANSGIPHGFAEKLVRNWFVQETGTVDSVLVRIPATAVAGFSDITKVSLIVADDAGFTTNVHIRPLVQNGGNYETIYDFNGARYFTFGIWPTDFMRHGKYYLDNVKRDMKF